MEASFGNPVFNGKHVIFVERHEFYPENANILKGFLLDDIINYTRKNELYIRPEEILAANPSCGPENFRETLNMSFILENEDACRILEDIFQWSSAYTIMKEQKLIPIEAFRYLYINRHVTDEILGTEHNNFIIMVFIDIEMIPEDFYAKFIHLNPALDDDDNLFISMLLTYGKYHVEDMNNLRVKAISENATIAGLIAVENINYLSHKMIDQTTYLFTNLYYYQRADVAWIQNRELNPTKFILDSDYIIQWGKKHQLIYEYTGIEDDELGDAGIVPNRTIHNYSGELNYFTGGIINSAAGIGKTLIQLVSCSLSVNISLIVTPEHLMGHWNEEYEKHFAPETMIIIMVKSGEILILPELIDKPIIVITSYIGVNDSILAHEYHRLIIDEFHELFDGKVKFSKDIFNINAHHKWAITATPFINDDMLHNLLSFVIKHKPLNKFIVKYKMYQPIFISMFRCNTIESTQLELHLPKINEKTYLLTFSEREALIYNTLININLSTIEYKKRLLNACINLNAHLNDTEGISSKAFDHVDILNERVVNMYKQDYETLHSIIVLKAKNIMGIKSEDISISDEAIMDAFNIFADEEKTPEKRLYLCSLPEITLLKTKINQLKTIKSNMLYFDSQMIIINDKIDKIKKQKLDADEPDNSITYSETTEIDESKIIKCAVCYDIIASEFTFLGCGHSFCSSCLDYAIKNNFKTCLLCRVPLKNTKFYTVRLAKVVVPVNSAFTILIENYGTKIAHLINICKTINDKIVVYCDSPNLIFNLVDILCTNDVCATTPTNIEDISVTITHNVLILSSDYNASGLNLQFAKTVIIIQPIIGSYSRIKQIENQIVGRLHRIGQRNEIDFIRLVMRDSIEIKMMNEIKLMDIIHEAEEIKMEVIKSERTEILL